MNANRTDVSPSASRDLYRVHFEDGSKSWPMTWDEAQKHHAERAGKGERGDGTIVAVSTEITAALERAIKKDGRRRGKSYARLGRMAAKALPSSIAECECHGFTPCPYGDLSSSLPSPDQR